MSRLFWKIFAWFWGAMIALLLVTVALEWLIPLEPQGVTQRALLTRALKEAAGRAAYELEIGEHEALDRELEAFENEADVQAFWLTTKGQEPPQTSLAAPPVTSIVSEIARQAGAPSAGGEAVWRVVAFQVYSAVKVPGYDNVLVIRFDRRPLAARFSSQLYRLLAVICTAGIVCWLLSRYLVAPIEALRRASRQLAAGNLAARVTPALPSSRRDEIALLSRDFDRMAGQLQTLVTAQGRLLGDVSHELRTPLTRLRLALALLERDGTPNENTSATAAHYERMEREIAALDALIDELLVLSRLENQLEAPAPATQTFDGEERLREVAAKIEWEAQQQGSGVQVRVECETPSLTLVGEAALFCRALENIGRNALRYSPPQGKIVFRLWHECNLGIITVTDQGPGVPPPELEAIFQPFHRVEGKTTPGTGLGLAIARRAALLHGGTLHATNRDPYGLELRLEWPVETDKGAGHRVAGRG